VAASAAVSPGAAPATPPPTSAPSVTFNVTRLSDSGTGTLRWAVQQANGIGLGTGALIQFKVSGTIPLASALPAITRTVTINGESAPGYKSGGAPVVGVNFRGNAGLVFAAGSGGSQLLGLSLGGAGSTRPGTSIDGSGVTLQASKITLNGNYIGLNTSGRALPNAGNGIYAADSSWNIIGANPSHTVGATSNVISANHSSGIVLVTSSHNTVQDNRIGTNPAGSRALPNGHGGVVLVDHANNNEIGGTAFTNPATGQANDPTGDKGTVPPVFVVPPLGNQISGNHGAGVRIEDGSKNNMLNGNFIGTTANGNGALGNSGNGVWISNSARNTLAGCKFVNNPFVYYNVISGNGLNGVRITSSPDATVQGNFFGSAANNSSVVPNRRNGILIDGNSANTQVGGVIPLGNVSAGNGRNGIAVTGTSHGFVTFNTFGGLHAFGAAAPNGRNGVLITSTGGNNLARTNVLSGNTRNGLQIAGSARGVTVDPDIMGLSTKGNALLPNGADGLRISGNAHGNTIGGSRRSVIRQNTFSGNKGYGIHITGHAHDNQVFSSYIGTAIQGTSALGNSKGGVLVAGHAYRNWIGRHRGRRPVNIISGNTGNGVTLLTGTSGNRVLRNFIGLGRFRQPLANSGRPVVNTGRHNVIRGNRT
jgi:parallel beta-helix repeat protein